MDLCHFSGMNSGLPKLLVDSIYLDNWAVVQIPPILTSGPGCYPEMGIIPFPTTGKSQDAPPTVLLAPRWQRKTCFPSAILHRPVPFLAGQIAVCLGSLPMLYFYIYSQFIPVLKLEPWWQAHSL